MARDDGQAITDIFETVYDGRLFFHLGQLSFGPFLQAAIKRAKLDNVRYTEKGCRAAYGPDQPEIIACSLALLFGEYAGRLLADKADKEHCDERTPSPLYIRMVREFREKPEALVKQIKEREKKWDSAAAEQ
jgi:hypothetical protein